MHRLHMAERELLVAKAAMAASKGVAAKCLEAAKDEYKLAKVMMTSTFDYHLYYKK